jgi:hypothetical protein
MLPITFFVSYFNIFAYRPGATQGATEDLEMKVQGPQETRDESTGATQGATGD